MKTFSKIILGSLCLMIATGASAQFPKISKPNIGIGKKNSNENSNTTSSTTNSGENNPGSSKPSEADEKERTDMIWFLKDRTDQRVILRWFDQYPSSMANPGGYKNFYAEVKKFDPALTKSKMAEAAKRWPDDFNDTHWMNTELKPIIDEMETKGDGIIQKETDELLVEADKSFKAGKFEEALLAISYAENLVDGVLLFNANNAGAKSMKVKVDSQRSKLSESLKKYYTSDYHAKNAGKIIFSKKPLSVGGQEGASVATQFNTNDNIYGMAYLNSRLGDYEKSKEMFMVLYYVDDNQVNGMNSNGNVVPADVEKSYFSIPVFTGPAESDMMLPSGMIQRLAREMSPGKHKVKIRLTTFALALSEKFIAEGEFELEASDMEKFKVRAEEHRKAMIAKVRMPAGNSKNPALEADMMKLMKKNFDEEIVSLRASILDTDWQIVLNEEVIPAVPAYRYIRGFVALKVPRTGVCYYRGIAIMQKYQGGGKYSTVNLLYDPGYGYDLFEMECANVNK